MKPHIFRQFREKYGISQASLGILLGISSDKNPQGRISHYENYRREVPISIAYAFIDYATARGHRYTLEHIYPRAQAVAAA